MLLGGLLLLTAALGPYALGARIEVREGELLPASSAVWRAEDTIQQRFGPTDYYVVVFESLSSTVFDGQVREDYRRLLQLLGEDPLLLYLVDPIERHRFRSPERGSAQETMPLLAAPDEDWLRGALALGCVTRKLNVSRDGRAILLYYPVRSRQLASPILERMSRARERFLEERSDRYRIRILGAGLVREVLGERIERDLTLFVPVVSLVVLVLLLVAFRSWWLALTALAEVGLASLWTMGLLVLAGRQVSLLTSLLPVLVMALGIADDIHLFAEFLVLRAEHPRLTGIEIARRARETVRGPVTWTSVTTALGFLSLLATDIPALQEFGLFGAVGTALSWLLTLTLAPFALAFLPPGTVPRWIQPSPRTPPGRVLWTAAIALTVVALPGVTFLRIDDAWTRNFAPHDEVVRDERWLERQSAGLHSFDVQLEAVGLRWDTPAGLETLSTLQLDLEEASGCNTVLSIVDLLRERSWELQRGDLEAPSLPSTSSEIARLLHSFRVFNEEAFVRQFLTEGGRSCRLAVFADSDDYRTMSALRTSIDTAVRGALGPDARLTIAGTAEKGRVLVGALAGTQLRATALCLVVIFAGLLLASGDLWSSVRCSFAIAWAAALVLGIAGWLGFALGVATTSFVAIALGTGVDYCVHLSSSSSGPNGPGAATRIVARRVLCNALIVGAALAVLLLSNNPTIRGLGTLLALSMWMNALTASVCVSPREVRARPPR